MDMSLEPNTLAALFEPSEDAVIGAEGRTVVFANPAAQKLTDAGPGKNLGGILPVHRGMGGKLGAIRLFRCIPVDIQHQPDGGIFFQILLHGRA